MAARARTRVHHVKSACDSFIYKRARARANENETPSNASVIRIYPLIPLHLLFTSCIPRLGRVRESRVSKCVSGTGVRVLSVDLSACMEPTFPLSLA